MDWKKLAKKFLFPPVWLMAVLVILTAVAVPYVLLSGLSTAPIAYGVYVIAFYTLCVVTVFCILVLPKQLGRIKQRIYANPFGNRYMTDPAFRTRFSMYTSLGINLLFVGVNALSWYLNRSWWFVVLAVYYCILAITWALLAGYTRRHSLGVNIPKEWKRARGCACILLSINLILSGTVLMILYQNKGFHYNGILIYVMALFAFYSTIQAIVDMIKYRSLGSPVMSTAKLVSLCAALVSMLSLETAMFSQFGADMAPEHQRLMIILTGAGVSGIVVTLSVVLIVKATKEIRSYKHGK